MLLGVFFREEKKKIRDVLELGAPVTAESRTGYPVENKEIKCRYAYSTVKPAGPLRSLPQKSKQLGLSVSKQGSTGIPGENQGAQKKH